MCKELESELKKGGRAAIALASHLAEMGASRFSIPITVSGVEIEVSAARRDSLPTGTLPLAEEKALIEELLFDIHCEEVDRTPMEEMPESLIDSSLRRREHVALAARGLCLALRLPGY